MKPTDKDKKPNFKNLGTKSNSLFINQTTQATSISGLTHILKTKGSLSNIVSEPSLKTQSRNIKPKTKYNSATKPSNIQRKSIVAIKDIREIKLKNNLQKMNTLLPTNINSYLHLIRDIDFSKYENLNWTLRLRDYSNQDSDETKITNYTDFYTRKEALSNIDSNNKSKKKMQLTENFDPPSFYDADLKKYKNSIKKRKRPMSLLLNPNYNKIRHLVNGKNFGPINDSQFQFSTTLGNFYSRDEHRKKWEVLPLVKNEKYLAKFLYPRTQSGINCFKKVDKFTYKKYDILLKDASIGGDKFKKKILSYKDDYTCSGIGETLGDQKYDNIFREKNIFYNKRILSTHTNPQCKFELGLRAYDDISTKNNRKLVKEK